MGLSECPGTNSYQYIRKLYGFLCLLTFYTDPGPVHSGSIVQSAASSASTGTASAAAITMDSITETAFLFIRTTDRISKRISFLSYLFKNRGNILRFFVIFTELKNRPDSSSSRLSVLRKKFCHTAQADCQSRCIVQQRGRRGWEDSQCPHHH